MTEILRRTAHPGGVPHVIAEAGGNALPAGETPPQVGAPAQTIAPKAGTPPETASPLRKLRMSPEANNLAQDYVVGFKRDLLRGAERRAEHDRDTEVSPSDVQEAYRDLCPKQVSRWPRVVENIGLTLAGSALFFMLGMWSITPPMQGRELLAWVSTGGGEVVGIVLYGISLLAHRKRW
jgi:hypothetical protein